MVAQTRGLKLVVSPVDHALFVDAVHQLLTAAVANLLQNAIEFTHPGEGCIFAIDLPKVV